MPLPRCQVIHLSGGRGIAIKVFHRFTLDRYFAPATLSLTTRKRRDPKFAVAVQRLAPANLLHKTELLEESQRAFVIAGTTAVTR